MLNVTALFDGSAIQVVFKILLLTLIALFGIFAFIIYNHINSLNKIVIVKDIAGAPLIRSLAIIILIASASLFVLALVIL